MNNPASQKKPEEMFADVVSYVEQARGMLSRGEWVELRNLDADIKMICDSIGGLTREQAKEYLPELEFLREQVQLLENEMKAQRDQVGDALRGANKIQKANQAYTQSQSLKDKT